jgi:ankyrin repeat protein
MFSKPILPERLQSALDKGVPRVVQEYLDNGIDPNLRNHDRVHHGRTLISFASMNGHTEVIGLLIKHGAKVDKPDFHGRTPLSWAAEHGQLDAVKLLLKHGAKVNTEDNDWETPLGWVIHTGTGDKIDEVQSYLLSQGAKEKLNHSLLSQLLYKVREKWNMLVFRTKYKSMSTGGGSSLLINVQHLAHLLVCLMLYTVCMAGISPGHRE